MIERILHLLRSVKWYKQHYEPDKVPAPCRIPRFRNRPRVGDQNSWSISKPNDELFQNQVAEKNIRNLYLLWFNFPFKMT